MDGFGTQSQHDQVSARQRVQIGPVPDWVTVSRIDFGYQGRIGAPVTDLLISRQVHAERREEFIHVARRLETMQAVQRESQWRIVFDPATQHVKIHWIRLHRNGVVRENADLGRMRILQREEALEGFVLDGWFTLLLLIDDVRPGDVIETSYSVVTVPRLMPQHCFAYFALPPGASVGAYNFVVRFGSDRKVGWKSMSAECVPNEVRIGNEVIWEWTGREFAIPEPEPNVPEWHLDGLWLQVSDCSSWSEVAAAVSAAWVKDANENALEVAVNEIRGQVTDVSRQIEKVIELVQDGHRYLSVNLDLGGQIPASPTAVLQRRYGDCKDLSFLLARLLSLLGVQARPVLVHARLRGTITRFLPSPSVFNHAIVEIEVAGRKQWLDPTLPCQGGRLANRFVPNYGCGLPVDPASSGLADAPRTTNGQNSYEVTETLLLDTTGAPSLLAVNLCLTGAHAENIRLRLATIGEEKLAEERVQFIAGRFATAKRIGQLRHRDNRLTNEFRIAEEFEIGGFLVLHQDPRCCVFHLPPSLVFEPLRLPPGSVRRSPLALPFPCNVIHTLEVESMALEPMGAPRASIEGVQLRFHRRQKSLQRFWSMTLEIETLIDFIPASSFGAHREMVEKMWNAAQASLAVRLGVMHPRKRHGFGQLPSDEVEIPAKETKGLGERAVVGDAPVIPTAPVVPRLSSGDGVRSGVVAAGVSRSGRKRRRVSRSTGRSWTDYSIWIAIVALVILITVCVIKLVAHKAGT